MRNTWWITRNKLSVNPISGYTSVVLVFLYFVDNRLMLLFIFEHWFVIMLQKIFVEAYQTYIYSSFADFFLDHQCHQLTGNRKPSNPETGSEIHK